MSDDLIDRIYEAAFVPDLWPDVFGRLSVAAGAAAATVVIYDGEKKPRFKTMPLAEPALRAFTESDAWKVSARVNSMHTSMMRELSHRWVAPEEFQSAEDLDRDPVQLVLRSLGMRSQTGTIVTMTTGEVAAFSVERWAKDGSFSSDDIAGLNAMRPHLARASLMAARLGFERAESAVAVLEKLGLPAAVMTAAGRVLAANGLLDRLPDIFVARAGGGLALHLPEADALLRLAVGELAGNAHASVRSIPIPGGEGRPALVVHLLPLRRAAHDIFDGGDVLIAATPANARAGALSPGILAVLFDLAPAEARLAAALANGANLKTVAAKQGLRVSSARTYLAQIFRKTGTHRQSELVALLKNTTPFGS